MRMFDLIEKKKHGQELSTEEIQQMITEYVAEKIPDYQMSAMLMAIYFKGMTDRELTDLTLSMAHSGKMVELGAIRGIKVDKHSTGGVGDKTTLVIAPIVAACGRSVAKMSGRGLGHTGGTIDKLESIPGFQTSISEERFFEIVNKIGVSVIGQSADLAPADKQLYALRDVTATVDSIPLIAASVMSKKLAAGSDCILLDVTCGSGAFMKNKEDAVKLAEKMVAIGEQAGRKTVALITNMDVPLGISIGNSLEVIEAIQVLKGEGPEDLKYVCRHLAANMLYVAEEQEKLKTSGSSGTSAPTDYETMIAPYLQQVDEVIANGSALKKLKLLITEQGGDPSVVDDTDRFRKAEYYYDVVARNSGYITAMDTQQYGIASMLLGAGRETKESMLDETAGIKIWKKTGDHVDVGDTIATLYSSSHAGFKDSEHVLVEACRIGEEKPEEEKLIIASVTKTGVNWL